MWGHGKVKLCKDYMGLFKGFDVDILPGPRAWAWVLAGAFVGFG